MTGCGWANPFDDNIPYKTRFEDGLVFFEDEKYPKAAQQFDIIVDRGSHTDLGDDALFFLAESYFLDEDYELALIEYEKLVSRMGFSPYIEKTRWRICETLMALSPNYYHDQESSRKAIIEIQQLQTGMINAMQTVPILSASSGWSALMPNMLDLKWGAFIGAVIIDDKVWSKIKPKHQKAMIAIAEDIGRKYQKNGREMEVKAIRAMEEYGMKVKTPSSEQLEVWESFKDEITPDVIDTFLSEEIYNKVTTAIDEQ